MSNFTNKVVWITGASSGIGEALVHEFAKAGSIIILSSRREEELKRVAAQTGLKEDRSLILPFDLSEIDSFAQKTEEVISKFKRIDILINNGGFSQRSEASFTPIDLDRKIMEVNYFANIALTKAVLPSMLKQGNGQIITISSIAGKFGFYLRSSYSAAKHALHGFYESLRLETENKGIKVLIVCPGKVKTNVSINAVTEDGSKHGKMDESHVNSMSAEQCAVEIIQALKAGKEEVFIGGKEINMIWIRRFFPRVFGKILRKLSPY